MLVSIWSCTKHLMKQLGKKKIITVTSLYQSLDHSIHFYDTNLVTRHNGRSCVILQDKEHCWEVGSLDAITAAESKWRRLLPLRSLNQVFHRCSAWEAVAARARRSPARRPGPCGPEASLARALAFSLPFSRICRLGDRKWQGSVVILLTSIAY